MRRLEVEIQAGTLSLALRLERLPLGELLTFATRENPKRPFLFLSKVLGRHWPCRPAAMRRTYDLLAAELTACPGPLLIVGLAETATALGHGVYDSLLRNAPTPKAIYQHTTRHRLERRIALKIEESHSHAVEHTVYAPAEAHREIFENARTLVLVDDEISTGNTLVALARAYLALSSRVEQVRFLTLASWLSPSRLAEIEREIDRPVVLAALIAGSFHFTPRVDFKPALASGETRASQPGRRVDERFGRLGFQGRCEDFAQPSLPPGSRVVVVGTGEFAFLPFRLAEDLEAAGHDVLFQSSTRSPILPGDAIRTKLTFPDHHTEAVTNYLYNYPDDGRLAIVGYEHPDLGRDHPLVGLLAARCWSPAPPGD